MSYSLKIIDWIRAEQNNDDEAYEVNDGKIVEISMHRRIRQAARRRAVVMVSAAALLFLVIFALIFHFQTYSNYKVSEVYTRSGDIDGDFFEFQDCIIRYNSDGVMCLSKQGEEKWAESFENNSPMAAVSREAFAVAEKGGTSIYVFSETGQIGQISTQYPIDSVSVSSQGIVAAILHDGSQGMVMCYDRKGDILVESRASLTETGYPMSAAISDDGIRLLVSYVNPVGMTSAHVVCYEFGTKETSSDPVVLDETYSDLLIPTVFYLGDTGVAVGDGKAFFYEGRRTMKVTREIDFEEQIISVFSDGSSIAFILRGEAEDSKYQLRIYSASGREKASAKFDDEFESAYLSSGYVFLMRNSGCTIFKSNGRRLFSGDFDRSVVKLFPESGINRFTAVFDDTLEQIRLVK